MKDRIIQLPIVAPEGHDAIVRGSRFPVIAGTTGKGSDFVCSKCGGLIAKDIVPGQLWEIVFQCPREDHHVTTPRLPAGEPIGEHVVVIQSGRHIVEETVQVNDGIVFASASAADRRQKELEERAAVFVGPDASFEMDNPEVLGSLIREAEVVTSNFFGVIMRSARPARGRHRLAEMIDDVSASIETLLDLRNPSPRVKAFAIFELSLTLRLLSGWGKDPAFPGMRAAMRDPGEFAHGLFVLAVARYMIVAGNDVGLRPASPRGRTSDLFSRTGPDRSLAIEIKAPRLLQHRTAPITKRDAVRIVRNALDSARTGERGQLSCDNPGLLVIGGFYIAPSEMQVLIEAGQVLLEARARRRRDHDHFAGIGFFSVGLYFTGVAGGRQGAVLLQPDGIMNNLARWYLVTNPNYQRAIQLRAIRLDSFLGMPAGATETFPFKP